MKIDYSKSEFTQDECKYMFNETKRLQETNPSHIPVLIQLDSNVLKMEKQKFLVSNTINFNDFVNNTLKKKLINLYNNDVLVDYSEKTFGYAQSETGKKMQITISKISSYLPTRAITDFDQTQKALERFEAPDKAITIFETSAKNDCLYCVVAHGALLRIYAKNPLVADQVAVNHLKADITPRQRAMLEFAVKVCMNSAAVTDEDYEMLYRHGFDDEDIWDIATITAFFGMSNRIANSIGMRPNEEFYLMGRLPKTK